MISRETAGQYLTARNAVAAVQIVFALSFGYFHFFRPLGPSQEAIFFLGATLAVTFILRPLRFEQPRLRAAGHLIDTALIAAAIASAAYLIADWSAILGRAGAPARPWDITMAGICLVATLEATRRVMPVLVPVALVFLAYAWFGQMIPGYLSPPRISVSRLTQVLYLSNNGLWGSGLRAGVQYIMPFLILGALLKAIGMMDIITAVALRFLRG